MDLKKWAASRPTSLVGKNLAKVTNRQLVDERSMLVSERSRYGLDPTLTAHFKAVEAEYEKRIAAGKL